MSRTEHYGIKHYGICGKLDVKDIIDSRNYKNNKQTEDINKKQIPVYREKR